MDVWVITANCGDYYCEGNHLVGVATTPEAAARIKEAAEAATATYHGRPRPRWDDVEVSPSPLRTDELDPDAGSYVYPPPR